MKAIVVEKPFEIRIAEVEKPRITRGDEVLIRVISGGICGSDIGIYNGTNSLATYPRIIGHEYGGRIEEVGPEVTGLRPGDVWRWTLCGPAAIATPAAITGITCAARWR